MRYKRRTTNAAAGVILLATVVLAASGCVRGPQALRASRIRYNQAIQQTTEEQLLLNLVRLRYRDAPLFLAVGSVSAQFEFDESAEAGTTIVENVGPDPLNPTTFNIGAKLRQVEKPTITFTPLQGRDFVEQVLTPIGLDTILLLTRSGWSIDRVLRLTVQGINGVDNAPSASGPTPDLAPSYEQFAAVAWQLRALQARGWAELAYESRPTPLAASMPATAVEAADLIAAAQAGYSFRPTEQGDRLVLTGTIPSVVLSLAPQAVQSGEVAEIARALNLAPGRARYEVRSTVGRTEAGQQDAPREDLAVETRSLLGILFYLCQAVEAPPDHQEAGWVTVTMDDAGESFDWTKVTGDLLRIRCDKSKPAKAAVAVCHRGYWFYVDEADLESKSTFALLAQLIALRAGGVAPVTPLLTLPIGG